MRKLDTEKQRFKLHAAQKRHSRDLKVKLPIAIKRKKNKRRSYSKPIEAPSVIDLYRKKYRQPFLKFIAAIKSKAKTRRTIFISFRNSEFITAPAALLLVAETDKLVKARPELIFKCSFPPVVSKGKHKNIQNLVESSLKQIGFFKLINQTSQKLTNQFSVKSWSQLSGNTADGSLASSLLGSLGGSMPEKVRRRMYRGVIEAIANCVEHAYPDEDINSDRRWWMLVGIDENDISVVVCDLGVGIPQTLPKHSENLLAQIFNMLPISRRDDAELIMASTYIKETRTKLSNRGKGSQDVRSIVDAFPSAHLVIRSNKGVYSIAGKDSKNLPRDSNAKYIAGTNSKERLSNYRDSIGGTIIEWVLTTKDFTK